MAPHVEYINPYGGASPGGAPRQLWFPALCLLTVMAAFSTGVYALTHASPAPAVIAPVPASIATPGPSVYAIMDDAQVGEETHDLCDYIGRGPTAENGVVAVEERYRCADKVERMRMRLPVKQ